MPIKLIALDMDGTSLYDDQTIGLRLITAVKAAQQRGVLVIFASGRWHAIMAPHYGTVGFAKTPQVTCNGAVIATPEGVVLERTPFPPLEYASFMSYIDEKTYPYALCTDVEAYAHDRSRGDAEYSFCKIMKENETLPFISKAVVGPISDEEAAYMCQRFDLSHARSMGSYSEFWDKNVNKGTAVLKVAALHGIARDEIMGVGDGDNDVGLFQNVGLGVAMGQGTENAKKAAKIIAPPLSEDGAAWAIEKFVLNA